MHELGHNFGSGHTHNGGYLPVIDTCGTTCPAGLPLAKSSTIMSYCHGCNGGYSNMDYTFGGKYKGTGSRSDINSYDNSPLAGLGTISSEPRQVNAKMWAHVSSRACTQNFTPGVSIVEYDYVHVLCVLPCASIRSRKRSPPPSCPQPITTSVTTRVPTSTPKPTSAPTPCVGGFNVQVIITTDSYPAETSWTLTNECGIQSSMSGGPFTVKNTVQPAVTNCLTASKYKFTINDTYGDGLCCDYGSGSYTVVVDGVNTITGSSGVGYSKSETFGTCEVSPPSPHYQIFFFICVFIL
jgi:hypothetical protein